MDPTKCGAVSVFSAKLYPYFTVRVSHKRHDRPVTFQQVRTDASRMSSVAIISSASASCGVATATRTVPTAATKKTADRLPRDHLAVTASTPAAATNNVSRRVITATWSATAWTAVTKSDAVSINERFIASLFYRRSSDLYIG